MCNIQDAFRSEQGMFGINTIRLSAYFLLLIIPALAGAAEKEPPRATIEAFVASKIWAVANSGRMEIGELDYEIYLDGSANSGRISVKGKLVLREDLYESDEAALDAAVKTRLEDTELVAEGLRRARSAYGNRVRVVTVVNQKGNWTPFEGNVFFQREVGGWSLSVPTFGEGIRYAEPAGRQKQWFMQGREPVAFIVVDSPEFEKIAQLAVSMGQAYENERLELVERLERFFENEVVIERSIGDNDAVRIFVFRNLEPFGPKKRHSIFGPLAGEWEFSIEGKAEFFQPLKRSFGRMDTGDIVPARLIGRIRYAGQTAGAPTGWRATVNASLPENWPRVRENDRFGVGVYEVHDVPWDGEKFEKTIDFSRTTWRVISHQLGGDSADAVDGTSGRQSGNEALRGGVTEEGALESTSDEAGEEAGFSTKTGGTDVGGASDIEVVESESEFSRKPSDVDSEEHVFAPGYIEQADQTANAGGVRESGTPSDRDIPAELLALAERGPLTVRALRGFGLLDAEEDRVVLALRSRGIDLLGADVRQLRLWADAGGVDEKSFSENEMLQLREVILKLDMVEEKVGLNG